MPDSETLLELVLSTTQEGIADHDLVAGTTAYSERFHMLLGFDAECRLVDSDRMWKELVFPDDLAELERLWLEHVEEGWPLHHVFRMRHCNGGYRWVLCRSTVRMGEDGTPNRALSLFSDVTEHETTERRHRALVDAIPDSMLRLGADGEVIDLRAGANSHENSWLRLVRIGKPLSEALPSQVAAELQSLARKAIGSSAPEENEWVLREGAEARHFEARARRSGPEEAVCVIRDVTERKALEGQLLQSQKLESIGQLAAGVAHEINTPLQFIGDNVRFLQTAAARILPLVEKQRDMLSDCLDEDELEELAFEHKRARFDYLLKQVPRAATACVEGVARVAEIVSAMKEFSHPGFEHPVTTDINRGLISTSRVSRHEWKHVAELELELAADLPLVDCYPGELNQCFLNIIVNAAHALQEHYGESKQGKIVVSTRALEKQVEVRIQDNGPGIPAAVVQRIFDPFFTTKGVGKGTGQGLSIARRTIVDKHQGELLCETLVGQGTAFIILLPTQCQS